VWIVQIHRPDRLAALRAQPRLLFVSDVDSTFIGQEVIELLAAHAGKQDEVAAVTAAAMRGELDFAASLHQRVATLAGLPVSVFDQVRDDRSGSPPAPAPWSRRCAIWASRSAWSAAASSRSSVRWRRRTGIEHVRANALEVVDGHLTGRVQGQVVDRAVKAETLQHFAAAEGLPLSRTVAIGDGANDLDMLAVAGLGIAFNAKPVVAAAADVALPGPRLDDLIAVIAADSSGATAESSQAQLR
jgi:phosphoserine phosphatase